eukprot:15232987-Alexandrium_andersonii.AAC.1
MWRVPERGLIVLPTEGHCACAALRMPDTTLAPNRVIGAAAGTGKWKQRRASATEPNEGRVEDLQRT